MNYMLLTPSIALLLLAACAQSPAPRAPVPANENSDSAAWKLVWSDEFNTGQKPDPSKWTYETGDGGPDGWGNQEAEYYTGPESTNASIKNRNLIIEARKKPTPAPARAYTSARLNSTASWKYGRIEVRAKLPKGRGTWPAIWLLASTQPLEWPDDGEIDIMEHVGHDPGKIHASIHCKDYNHVIHTQKTAITDVPDCSDTFHVYSMQWDAEHIAISVDGHEYFRFSNEHKSRTAWPFDQPFHLLLNVAVGGFWGGEKGIDDTIWPQRMEIDYVRVYQQQ